jgi:hypothetical protein
MPHVDIECAQHQRHRGPTGLARVSHYEDQTGKTLEALPDPNGAHRPRQQDVQNPHPKCYLNETCGTLQHMRRDSAAESSSSWQPHERAVCPSVCAAGGEKKRGDMGLHPRRSPDLPATPKKESAAVGHKTTKLAISVRQLRHDHKEPSPTELAVSYLSLLSGKWHGADTCGTWFPWRDADGKSDPYRQ